MSGAHECTATVRRERGTPLPEPEDIAALHERAHHDCFIANSVTTEITVSPRTART